MENNTLIIDGNKYIILTISPGTTKFCFVAHEGKEIPFLTPVSKEPVKNMVGWFTYTYNAIKVRDEIFGVLPYGEYIEQELC